MPQYPTKMVLSDIKIAWGHSTAPDNIDVIIAMPLMQVLKTDLRKSSGARLKTLESTS
jgi:hypothetical protein